MRPRSLILRTAGTNCDAETAHAFDLAGAESRIIHLNAIISNPQILNEFEMLAIPGGFSYGDDISAGRILANQLTHHLGDALRGFVAAGKPVIGICNGFQVLIKTDLLPGHLEIGNGSPCTLTSNSSGRFVDRWVHLTAPSKKCIWTAGLPTIELPVAHGEGRFVPRDSSARSALWDHGHVALIYSTEKGSPANGSLLQNPNGSVDDIAGICDGSGLILGLMPHPERHVSGYQHPAWTRQPEIQAQGPGMLIFKNAVRHVELSIGAGI